MATADQSLATLADLEKRVATGRVTAAQVEAGLPSGRYSITGAEMALLAGLGLVGGGFIDVYTDPAFQQQIVTLLGAPYTQKRRRSLNPGWSAWG